MRRPEVEGMAKQDSGVAVPSMLLWSGRRQQTGKVVRWRALTTSLWGRYYA